MVYIRYSAGMLWTSVVVFAFLLIRFLIPAIIAHWDLVLVLWLWGISVGVCGFLFVCGGCTYLLNENGILLKGFLIKRLFPWEMFADCYVTMVNAREMVVFSTKRKKWRARPSLGAGLSLRTRLSIELDSPNHPALYPKLRMGPVMDRADLEELATVYHVKIEGLMDQNK